jgi:hypothetical protein
MKNNLQNLAEFMQPMSNDRIQELFPEPEQGDIEDFNEYMKHPLITISEKVTSLVVNKWLVQVIDTNGKFHYAYFAIPPDGVPRKLHANKLEALTSVLMEVQNA